MPEMQRTGMDGAQKHKKAKPNPIQYPKQSARIKTSKWQTETFGVKSNRKDRLGLPDK